jgi:hypothetical protein
MPGATGAITGLVTGTTNLTSLVGQLAYDAVIAGDTTLMEKLALNLSGGAVGFPSVDSYSNSPPVALFH